MDAAQEVYTLKRVAESAKEWNETVVAIQIDLNKALDRIRHETCHRRDEGKGVLDQLIAVLCRKWQRSTIKEKLNNVTSRNISLHRGVLQGAPESPLIFTCVTDELMSNLVEETWSGLGMDALWVPTVGYAHDVIILSSRKEDGVNILVDCIEISAEAGLEVGLEKGNWTSTEPQENGVLKIGKDEVKWSSNITFAGTVEFGGQDAKALQYRTGQATKKDRNVGFF